jgi:hypothetical protein
MSLFKAALAGAAQAGDQILTKYIDEDLAAKRAQMMADLQRKTAGAIRQDDADFSDKRAPVLREQAKADVLAKAEAARAAELAGLNDQSLRGARRTAADEESAAATQRKASEARALMPVEAEREKMLAGVKTDADIERATKLLPLEVKRAYAIADAQGRAGARNRQSPGSDLMGKVSAIEKTLGRSLTEPEKLGILGLAGKGANAEYDLVKIKEEEMLPGGGTRTTERTERRQAGGAGGQAEDPYAVKPRGQQGAKDPYAQAPAAGAKQPTALLELARRKAAQEAPKGEMETAGNETLRRIAAIQGHAKQAAAKAELERRAAAQPEIDTSGIGYGGM